MCSDLWEGPRQLHNYADLPPTATSGHVLTDIPTLLKDARWEVFSSCVCLHYLSFFLSSQSYANTLTFQRLLLWKKNFFFLSVDNWSFQCCECFFSPSSRLNMIMFSYCSLFGCVALNLSEYLTAQLQLCCVVLQLSGLFPRIVTLPEKDCECRFLSCY